MRNIIEKKVGSDIVRGNYGNICLVSVHGSYLLFIIALVYYLGWKNYT